MELWSEKLLISGKGELVYACYKRGTSYYYAKVPLGSSYTMYVNTNGGSVLAKSSSELKNGGSWTDISENTAYYLNSNEGTSLACSRYAAGDLYE